MTKIALLLLSVSSLVACQKSTISESVDHTLEVNQKAQSHIEWESSESHPSQLFAQLRSDSAFALSQGSADRNSEKLCQKLSSLSDEKLTLFENEIKDSRNSSIVAPCVQSLLSKLDNYFKGQASTLLQQKTSRSFSRKIQVRDTSRGYFAVAGDLGPKEVVLTFDDGPSKEYTPRILKALRDYQAKAIFFTLGKSVKANPGTLKLVAADGHSIGSHSATHSCLGTRSVCQGSNTSGVFSFEKAKADIVSGHQAIFDVIGWADPFFRFPYGESSVQLKNFLKERSFGEFYWSIDSLDWKAQSNESLLRNTLSLIESKGRGIVLFHDIQRRTAEVMPAFLEALLDRGYSVVVLEPADPSLKKRNTLLDSNKP